VGRLVCSGIRELQTGNRAKSGNSFILGGEVDHGNTHLLASGTVLRENRALQDVDLRRGNHEHEHEQRGKELFSEVRSLLL
jgi:hypothetical protein